jgi:nucleoside-diphosphate-sugar epimerase
MKNALPPGSLVLVTGANSWQGMHVVDKLLEMGFRVRGTVRDAEKAISTSKYFNERYGPGRYTTAVIPSMVPQGAFDIAVRGCSGVVHIASVMSFSSNPHEVITPTIAGALNALEASAKDPGIKRFVYCSAAAAAVSQGTGSRHVVTSDSWNMAAFKAAWEPSPYEPERAWAVFSSSKMQAEQAVWRWCRANKPAFAVNTGMLSRGMSPGLS